MRDAPIDEGPFTSFRPTAHAVFTIYSPLPRRIEEAAVGRPRYRTQIAILDSASIRHVCERESARVENINGRSVLEPDGDLPAVWREAGEERALSTSDFVDCD